MLFDLEGYRLRKLDPAHGTKPLDFGGGGINGSITLDGRFIAINSYHPEHGIVTLTSVPPFPDADRYDQAKVRAYRKSLVTNEGFGLSFEQAIIEREYYLIEDAVPFLRFTLADGTVAECVTIGHVQEISQIWKTSREGVRVTYEGKFWLQRAAYTQLTEGGIVPMPSHKTVITERKESQGIHIIELANHTIDAPASTNIAAIREDADGLGFTSQVFELKQTEIIAFGVGFLNNNGIRARKERLLDYRKHHKHSYDENSFYERLDKLRRVFPPHDELVISRSKIYGHICTIIDGNHGNLQTILTDHMILPLSWNRDGYYVFTQLNTRRPRYTGWMLNHTWRGTYCKHLRKPISSGWGRSYMANGKPKDSGAYQLDQQIFPLLAIADEILVHEADKGMQELRRSVYRGERESDVEPILKVIQSSMADAKGLYGTDETPADDDIPLHFHFSSHVLLWYALKRVSQAFEGQHSFGDYHLQKMRETLEKNIPTYFITEHNGKQIYSYATDGEGNHYIYHDANDIPLVMMPLWGFCDKDDPIWHNTIDFAFSDANPGFYDGVLGSVHTPAPWALGDAQELIFCKVIGDRNRYQRVWERVEKAAQWDGALPEAYNAQTYEVVSRHWFAWPNAMVAIADGISWDWETEGEYAR